MTDRASYTKPPETVRVFIAGVSGSGKSTAAWTLYLSRYPRRILLDQTGEWADRADHVVTSVPELSWAIKKLAPKGRWTISVETDLDALPELVTYLIPMPDISRSPIRTVGGAVLLVDEVDLIAPPQTARQEVRTLFRRSRHAGLSIVATTQRPENVSREVSAQSQQVLCLHLVEPRGLVYMADLMQTDLTALAQWTKKHPHGGLWYEVRTGRRLWLTESGKFTVPQGAAEPAAPVRGQAPGPEPEPEESEPGAESEPE
jgi:hypothetical protein